MAKIILTSVARKMLNIIIDNHLPKCPCGLRVAFIPSAANNYRERMWIDEDRKNLKDSGFKVTDVDIVGKNQYELDKMLCNIDIIFVAGGNTFYLLQEAKKSGFDKLTPELVSSGVIYIGSSAGSPLAGPTISPMKYFDDPSEATELTSHDALGLVDFFPFVHHGRKKYGEVYSKMLTVLHESKINYVLLTDKQGIVIEDDHIEIIETI